MGFISRQKTEKNMTDKRIPIQEGLFVEADSSDGKPYLLGNKCKKCGIEFIVYSGSKIAETKICSQCRIEKLSKENKCGN